MKSNTADMVFEGLLRIADDNLILGHRTSEWCGHAPTLEEDLALPNIALDFPSYKLSNLFQLYRRPLWTCSL